MFRPDHSLDLLAELGIDPAAVREVIDDDRAIRCPERAAVFPAYGFASLTPEPAVDQGLHEPAPDDPWGPAPARRPAGRRRRRA